MLLVYFGCEDIGISISLLHATPSQTGLSWRPASYHGAGHINKSAIFQDDQDEARFLERLGQIIIEGECTVYGSSKAGKVIGDEQHNALKALGLHFFPVSPIKV